MTRPLPDVPDASSSVDRTLGAATLATLRTALLVVLAFGMVGLTVELFLLGHTEDTWQWVPIVLLAGALLAIGYHLVRPSVASVRAIQLVMWLVVLSSVLGVVLHYKGNVEFEREMYPALGGWQLFKQAMTGATPALAPGTMLQFGLIGLLGTFRHPLTTRG